MHDKKELCDKITSMYPDIGTCGIDIDVSYDDEILDISKIQKETVFKHAHIINDPLVGVGKQKQK